MSSNIEINYLDSIMYEGVKLHRISYLDQNVIIGSKAKPAFRLGGYCCENTEFENFSGVIQKNVKLINCKVGSNVHLFGGTFIDCTIKRNSTLYNPSKKKEHIFRGMVFAENSAIELNKLKNKG